MNPQGDPRSYHRWSIWRPMDYLGFAENVSNKSGETIPHMYWYQMSKCLSKMRTPFGPFWPFFYWLHGLRKLLIGGLPRNEMDQPTINHVRRARILHSLQQCWANVDQDNVYGITRLQWANSMYQHTINHLTLVMLNLFFKPDNIFAFFIIHQHRNGTDGYLSYTANAMAADVLALCIPRASAVMVLL